MKNIKNDKLLGLSSTKAHIDYYPDLLTNKNNPYISGFGINFSTVSEKYYREYKKIQNLTAEVGGILKIYLEIGYFIVGTINLYFCKLSFSNNLLLKNNNIELYNSLKVNSNGKISKVDIINNDIVPNIYIDNSNNNNKSNNFNNSISQFVSNKFSYLETNKEKENIKKDCSNKLDLSNPTQIQKYNSHTVDKSKDFIFLLQKKLSLLNKIENDCKSKVKEEIIEVSFLQALNMAVYMLFGNLSRNCLCNKEKYDNYKIINNSFIKLLNLEEITNKLNYCYSTTKTLNSS